MLLGFQLLKLPAIKMLSLACADGCLPNLNLTMYCASQNSKAKNKKIRHKNFSYFIYLDKFLFFDEQGYSMAQAATLIYYQ